MKRVAPTLSLSLLLLTSLSCSDLEPANHKVVILGIDGMDPRILQDYLDQGILPHFKRFLEDGDFAPLQTTMPPLSPVAWATFITGLPPEEHGIFDFLHRDPATMTPEFSMARSVGSDWNLQLGSWVLPLKSARVEQLRKGRAFWEFLEDQGVSSTLYRIPVNFPPVHAGRSLSGMGTPDLLGTAGTFSFYTDEWFPEDTSIPGGRIYQVEVVDYSVLAQLIGPPNPYRRSDGEDTADSDSHGGAPMRVDFRITLDPEHPLARIELQGQDFILRQGEWSEWVEIRFEAIPHLADVAAVARLYLQEVHPDFRLYVSPLQISPQDPAMPISYPEDWAQELYRNLGYFYTQELPEDTKAFSGGIFDGHEFWNQLQIVYQEQREALDYALDNFKEGLLFFYLSSLDQGSHMLWRYHDPEHPAYQYDPLLSSGLRTLYQEMDEALGRVIESADEDTTVIVMSDHGFCPFYWEVNLNSWLAEQGYIAFASEEEPRPRGPLFEGVEWSRTEAYALGLNGVYVNLAGREEEGTVPSGEPYQLLLDRLEADLLQMKDPRNGRSPVSFVLKAGRDYPPQSDDRAPDLIVGYARGYRSSWQSPLGEFPEKVFLDNLDPWSGDHSIDYREVPGVLLSNRRISLSRPALRDLTVTVLDEFGVPRPSAMQGRDCLD